MHGADLVTAGGRVLNAVGSGPDLAAARAAAYAVADSVEFRGAGTDVTSPSGRAPEADLPRERRYR